MIYKCNKQIIVEQLSLPSIFSWVPVTRSLVLCVFFFCFLVVCPFVIVLLIIVLSVLRNTDSDYPSLVSSSSS